MTTTAVHFECYYCPATFSQATELVNHFKAKHERLFKLQHLIEEYADCRNELSLSAVAKGIDEMYQV